MTAATNRSQDPSEEPMDTPMREWDRQLLARLTWVIERHLHEPDLDVDRLAKLVHVSRRTLYRKTQELLGTSPAALLREARLDHAFLLIHRQGAENVAALAQQLGISDEHLIRLYKARYGVGPGQHLRRSRELPILRLDDEGGADDGA